MRKVILLVVFGMLLLITGYVYWYYYNPKSEGTREGIVQKFSHKGNVFKTWEGEMVQQGFGQRGGNFNANYFYFSVVNDLIADSLGHGALGKVVRVHYVQYRRTLPWRGDKYNGKNAEPGQYVVDGIEEVRPLPY